MNRIYTFLLTTVCCTTFCSTGYAGANDADLMKARYLYTHLAFNEAIPYYEKVAGEMNDPEIYAQLGDCYRLTKQAQQAVVYYAKAVTMSGAKPITKLHYAQTLLSLQKYEDAMPWLMEYQKAFPEDRRVANLIKGARQAPSVYAAFPEGGTRFLSVNTDGNEFGPALKHGELLITADTIISGRNKKDYWTGNPYYNMYALRCDSLGNPFGEYRKVGANLNTKFHDGPVTFTADGKDAYFTRTNFTRTFFIDNARKDAEGVVHLQIMQASGYDQATGRFSSVRAFPFNSRNYSTAHPSISPSGRTLVFSSDMPNGEGGTDLYICRLQSDGSWSNPENLGRNINTEGEEVFPYLFDDHTLYFSSDGWYGIGGLDIYKSVWSDRDGVFSAPELLGVPINSASDDMSLVLTADGNSGYFASNRVAPKRGDNIFMLQLQKVFLQLNIVDDISGQPVSGCSISLESATDKRNFTSDREGSLFTRLYPQSNYVIRLARLGYETQAIDLSTVSKRSNDTLWQSVRLKPHMHIGYQAVVMDKDTRMPIENPWVVMTRIGGDKKPDSVMVPTGGSYQGQMEANAEYQVYAVKPDYYSDEKIISTKGIIPGAKDVVRDTIFMKKLEVGAIVRIENIYYDYDKANIREDAKPSLNRLLELMHQNKTMRIRINSHTDCRGSDSYNKRLSDARAASVVHYMIESGVEAVRMESKGYGESLPIEICGACERCTEVQHQQNRRTEFEILAL